MSSYTVRAAAIDAGVNTAVPQVLAALAGDIDLNRRGLAIWLDGNGI